MKITRAYSHKNGKAFIEEHFPQELAEIYGAVEAVDISLHKTKQTRESGARFRVGQLLYSPISMNKAIAANLSARGWRPYRVTLRSPDSAHEGFREMDGIKNKLGLEIQFGKYAFMGYDILGKMPIFARRGLIVAGVELVPVKEIALEMSSGVSYFEQITADLSERGAADLDVPTLVLGIGYKNPPKEDE